MKQERYQQLEQDSNKWWITTVQFETFESHNLVGVSLLERIKERLQSIGRTALSPIGFLTAEEGQYDQ